MTTEHPIVKLNIGGTVFQTIKSTLTKFDGMFKVMMETDIPVIKDETGAIFIDRDPNHFRLILNFMRDGDVELPNSEEKIKEIHKEAHYYLLDGLVKLCEEKLEPVENPKKMKFIEKDSELLEILQKATKYTLVFHCPVNSLGVIEYPSYPFNVNDFLEKMKDKVDTYFKIYQHECSGFQLKWDWTFYRKHIPIARTILPKYEGFQDHLEKFIDAIILA